MAWSIVGVRAVSPSSGTDVALASVVELQSRGNPRHVLVELAITAGEAGVRFDPREAVARYLGDKEPPKRLLVTTDGVRVRPEGSAAR